MSETGQQIPSNALVKSGANYTGWQLWLDAALDGELSKIRNSPADNPNSKNATLFGPMCAIVQLAAGNHITKEVGQDAAYQAACDRYPAQFKNNQKEFDRQWNNAWKRAAPNPRIYEPPAPAEAGEVGRPLPTDDELSVGYHIHQNRLVNVIQNRHGDLVVSPIANIYAQIKQVITTEMGDRSYIISGKGWQSKAFEVELGAEDFESDAKVRAVVGAACPYDPIFPRMSQHLPAAIKLVSQKAAVSELVRYERCGWAAGSFLLPGREPNGVECMLPPHLPYLLNGSAGKIDRGVQALEALIDSIGGAYTLPVIATIFGSAAARPLGLGNKKYGMFIVGKSGSLKTSFTATAMGLYGRKFFEDEMYLKWHDTTNSVMKLAAYAADVPLLIDNFKPNTAGGVRSFVNAVHVIIEGREKARLNRNSDIREMNMIHAWPIFTGEALPDVDMAALARLLPVQFPVRSEGELNEELAMAQARLADLEAVGESWLSWLEGQTAEQWAGFAELYADGRQWWGNYINQHQPQTQNPLRVAQNLATNRLFYHIMCQHPALKELLESYSDVHRAGLYMVASHLNVATDTALEATRLIEGIRQLVTLGVVMIADDSETILHEDKDRVIGYEEKERGLMYLLPETCLAKYRFHLRDDLNMLGVTDIGRQLDGAGWLAKKSEGRLQVRKRVGVGKRQIMPRFWCVPTSLIFGDYEGDGSDSGGHTGAWKSNGNGTGQALKL